LKTWGGGAQQGYGVGTDNTCCVKRAVLIHVVPNRTVSKHVVFIRALNTVCLNCAKCVNFF
jgi:hypothetical protein